MKRSTAWICALAIAIAFGNAVSRTDAADFRAGKWSFTAPTRSAPHDRSHEASR